MTDVFDHEERQGSCGSVGLQHTMGRPERAARVETAPVAWSVAARGAVRGRSLAQTTLAALAVGSVLFLVNLYPQVREGPFTWALAGRIALTFLVPWCNATTGIAIGLRRPGGPPRPRALPVHTASPGGSVSPSARTGCSPAGSIER
ncbi:hypothetical protein [Streptomyces chromofuscus]|uniref:Uncharacterized protein n=1 Tax=Streptomyces chromofuscus TaxID=42881 RepID=A0A7M2T7R1_STRCW|nr:hypothetical protein [Streptomyces chromofuscus]QOV44760.1 hypothetical protein IPT68_01690 [Streptomyces chromofuscus]GGT00462.1 hypothetical protein GCM10010254_20700 [Streptomyces chromofuscus]